MFADKIWAWALAGVLAYLCGSFSGSITVSSILHKTDIRKYGSGNAGMTNTLRTYGKRNAVLVILLDALKTVAAVLVGRYLVGQEAIILCGSLAVIGHAFPVYYKFKGGKGVLCAATVILLFNLNVFYCAAVVFFGVLLLTRMVSVASLSCAITFPLFTWYFVREPKYIIFAFAVGALVVWLHRENIKRLIAGTESKIGKK